MTGFHYEIQEPGLTVEQLLRERWEAGKKTVHALRMAKSVTDNQGNPLDWKEPLPAGTQIHIDFPDAVSAYAEEDNQSINVVYEDEHILAAVKSAGITVHPDTEGQTGTFMNQVMSYVRKEGGNYAEHVHRLDRGTAGVLLITKHPIAKSILDRMFEKNEITRLYEAEVDGFVKKPKGTLSYPIGKDRHHGSKRRVSPAGQPAVTHFTVLKRLENTTLVEAQLVTGRTHQIRVHMSHIGHPVKGDTLYDGSETNDGQYRLTASGLSFLHPFTNEHISITMF